jgi:predicted nucleic acid-binding protein
MNRNSDRLFLSTVTIAEIVGGIAGARRRGALRKAEALDLWLRGLLGLYAERVLAFDLDAARATGPLLDQARAAGVAPGFADLAIAGIASARGLVVLTRNLRHFAPLGIAARDPHAPLPD